VRVIQAGLRQLYLMERAYASCAAHLLGRLGITTPSTLHTHRGMPVDTDRCEVCETSGTRRWEITGDAGPTAVALIAGFLASHDRGPKLTAMRRLGQQRLPHGNGIRPRSGRVALWPVGHAQNQWRGICIARPRSQTQHAPATLPRHTGHRQAD